ncbi:MAG: hypothetical protein II979_11215, partial [Clostridia bacterium]|nr:hypothetical protein [Clostridia bacterium]
MKKHIAVLLLASLLLTACGSAQPAAEEAVQETDAAVQTETETEDPIAGRTLQDAVPELDFGGAEFRSIVQESTPYDIYVAESTGDTLNDSIFNRNKTIEERFNVVIAEAAAKNHGQIASEVKAVVTAGDDAYDLVLGQMEESGKNALEGYFRNWYDIPHVNFENPWYPKSLVQDGIASVNGKMYVAMSDLCISYAEQTWSIAYDKVQADNYGITNVYETVREGKWTIDKLMEWTENIYTDVNNDGAKDAGDFYGYLHQATGCHLAGYLYGFDQRTVDVQGETPVMILNTEKTVSIFEKLYRLNQFPGTFDVAGTSFRQRDMFPAGGAVFATMQLGHCYNHMREFENPYGIIPFPKWEEAQAEYYSIVDAGCNIIAVLMTAQNTEMIGALVEALSAESWRSVMPT